MDPLPAAFADILRQLSPGEAAFLDRGYDDVNRRTEDMYLGTLPDLFFLATGEHAQFGTSPDLFELADGMIEHAASLGLIEGPLPGNGFHMTRLGLEFVRAWRATRRS